MSATTRAAISAALWIATLVLVVTALILESGHHWRGSTTALWFAVVALQSDYWLNRGKR